MIKILIIDDEKDFLTTLSKMFEVKGFEVSAFNSAEPAIEEVKRNKHDIALVDVRMPGISGLNAVRAIKKVDKDLPVIMMTGYSMNESVETAVSRNSCAVVYKPFQIESLLEIINRAINKKLILVVDDEYYDESDMENKLNSQGRRYKVVDNEEEALELSRGGSYDTLVIKKNILSENILQLISSLISEDINACKVVLSNISQEDYLVKCLKNGKDTYIYKTIDMEKLFTFINKYNKDEAAKNSKDKILLVDDDKSLRKIIEKILQRAGYEVYSFGSGKEALSEARKSKINLGILDFKLPDISGLDLSKELHKIDKDIKVIIVTGHASLEMAVEAIKEDVDEYLIKPVDPGALKHSIKTLLEKQRLIFENRRLMEKLKEKNRELGKLSITDELTGIYNHRYFYKKLNEEVLRARRQNHVISLLFIDVDGFKSYNDTKGHLQGDRVLERLGKIINKSIRENVDSAFRYGGDEFAVILPEARINVAERIGKRISSSFLSYGFEGVSLSVGAVQYANGESEQEFLERADETLYSAKRAGGNQVKT